MPSRPDRASLAVAGLILLLLMVPPVLIALREPFFLNLATRIVVFGLAAASLDLILGFGGLISFGHAAFVGLGAYTVGILFFHHNEGTTLFGWPGTDSAWIAWPAAALVAGLAALAIGAVCLRTRGVPFIMITLAFAQMLYFFLFSLRRYGGQDGIPLWSRSSLGSGVLEDNLVFYYVCLACLLAFLLLGHRLYGSRFGRVLRGAKDNERRMKALGFPTYRYRLAAFVISGTVAGLAGALLANATLFVGPDYLAWHRSGDLIAMVVLGGIGTLIGPVLGAAALLTLEEFLPPILDLAAAGAGEHWKIVLGPLLLLVALSTRRGLFGLLAGAARR